VCSIPLQLGGGTEVVDAGNERSEVGAIDLAASRINRELGVV
jgi:hypothetical protein